MFKTFVKDKVKKNKRKEIPLNAKKAKDGIDMVKANSDFGLAPKINKVNLLTFKTLKVGMLLLGRLVSMFFLSI